MDNFFTRRNLARAIFAIIVLIIVSLNLIPNNMEGQIVNSALNNSYLGNILLLYDFVAIVYMMNAGHYGIAFLNGILPHIISIIITFKTIERTKPINDLIEWFEEDKFEQKQMKRFVAFFVYFFYALICNCVILTILLAITNLIDRGMTDLESVTKILQD
jgi:hypothetical protein